MKVRLQVTLAGRATGIFEHEGAGVHLGRDPACELALDGAYDSVSWRHARLDLSPHGAILYDLGSTNGTYVNDVKIASPTRVAPGDRIRLGLRGPEFTLLALMPPTGQRNPVLTPIAVPLAAPIRHGSAVMLPALKRPSARPTLALRMLAAVGEQRHRQLLVMGAAVAVFLIGLVGIAFVVQLLLLGLLSEENKSLQDDTDKIKQQLGKSSGKDKSTPKDTKKKRDVDLHPGPAIPAAAKDLYEKAVRSVVIVEGKKGKGTGTVINLERKFVVTSFHVLQGGSEALVYFPLIAANGKVITAGKYHQEKARPVSAKVVTSDAQSDLVLLELVDVPEGFKAMQLSGKGAAAGDRVHTISCPENGEVLWIYGSATVKDQVRKEATLASGQRIDCLMLQLLANGAAAESGSPVFDDQGELVGVYSSVLIQGAVGNSAVDIRELLRMIVRIR